MSKTLTFDNKLSFSRDEISRSTLDSGSELPTWHSDSAGRSTGLMNANYSSWCRYIQAFIVYKVIKSSSRSFDIKGESEGNS